jgi:predicted nucleic acid-binding protein
MGSPTCLNDSSALIVLDASVAINLTASGYAADILRALPNPKVVVDVVTAELAEGRRRGRQHADLLDKLVADGVIDSVIVPPSAEAIYESLVIGSAVETLDDGEAATIAYAVEVDAIALIDERKAIRICGQKFPKLRLGCTIDLLCHPAVEAAIARSTLGQAVVNALQNARMRVLPHHVDWVIGLIGQDEAARCTSLPRIVRRPVSHPIGRKV